MPIWLIDTSVWARTAQNEDIRERVAGLIEANAAATCTPIMLEVFRSARNERDFEELKSGLTALHHIAITTAVECQALATQAELVRSGQHRGVGRTDLLVAACAYSVQVNLLHYDRDYERIAAISGQSVEWVVTPGTA